MSLESIGKGEEMTGGSFSGVKVGDWVMNGKVQGQREEKVGPAGVAGRDWPAKRVGVERRRVAEEAARRAEFPVQRAGPQRAEPEISQAFLPPPDAPVDLLASPSPARAAADAPRQGRAPSPPLEAFSTPVKLFSKESPAPLFLASPGTPAQLRRERERERQSKAAAAAERAPLAAPPRSEVVFDPFGFLGDAPAAPTPAERTMSAPMLVVTPAAAAPLQFELPVPGGPGLRVEVPPAQVVRSPSMGGDSTSLPRSPSAPRSPLPPVPPPKKAPTPQPQTPPSQDQRKSLPTPPPKRDKSPSLVDIFSAAQPQPQPSQPSSDVLDLFSAFAIPATPGSTAAAAAEVRAAPVQEKPAEFDFFAAMTAAAPPAPPVVEVPAPVQEKPAEVDFFAAAAPPAPPVVEVPAPVQEKPAEVDFFAAMPAVAPAPPVVEEVPVPVVVAAPPVSPPTTTHAKNPFDDIPSPLPAHPTSIEVVESISMVSTGTEVSKHAITGEIKVSGASTVQFRLVHRGRVDKIVANPAVVTTSGEGEAAVYTCVAQAEPAVAIRYRVEPSFRPIPIKVVPAWGVVDGVSTLAVSYLVHPSLTSPLEGLSFLLTFPSPSTITRVQLKPQGMWAGAQGRLLWKVTDAEAKAGGPQKLLARIETSAPPVAPVPVFVKFKCDNALLSSLELTDLQSPGPTTVTTSFVSGVFQADQQAT